MRVTLTHIGAVSLGRLLAIWTFVIGLLSMLLWGLFSIVLALIGMAAGGDVVSIIIGIVISIVMGAIGLVVAAVVMFIFGFVMAWVYNIILGVGGGIDLDLNERH